MTTSDRALRARARPRWIRLQRLMGVARVMAYVFVASLVVAALAGRVVYADYTEASLRAGRELEELDDVVGSTKTVLLNGTALNVSTAFTDQSPTEVLDRFQSLCERHPQFLVRALTDIPATLHDKTIDRVRSRGLRLTVARKEIDGEGALSCFTDDRPAKLEDLASRFESFAKTRDLAEFGRFRYVYVHRTDQGTHVRTVWTDGSMNLGEMFPAKGDAAGFDSTIVPRPPTGKRILSAGSAEVPFGLHMYDSQETPDAMRAFYDREMEGRGWRRAGDTVKGTAVYVKNGDMVYVTLSAKGTRTLVTTTEAARPGGDSTAAVRAEN